MAKFENILETIGNTPVVRVKKLVPPGVNLYVKIEAFNPMGSVKDRLARGILEDAEARGALRPGQTVIEATSGNTGIGLAMVCAQKSYPLVVTMAENFSIERRKLLRFLGAKVVLTPASEKGSGMLAKAVELSEKHGWFLCRQFENEANANVHSATTAREILADFKDSALDYWVTGYGTGGTLKGVARVLKQESPNTKIVVCEPDNSQILGSDIPQPESGSHPLFRPHLMQGWSPDFIPKLTQDAAEDALFDEVLPVSGAESLELTKDLARKEGIFVGISSGATFAGALAIAQRAPEGSTILCMLPDTGERYLSTPLFENVSEDMSADEIEISKSTLSFRFDANEAAEIPESATPNNAEVMLDAEAKAFVESVIQNQEHPVAMFALEWCEFCWSVRKLFNELKIPYHSVDLDSVEYQSHDKGGKIREVLKQMTSQPTIPQIFVGGKHVGGCTELFDAHNCGDLADLLSTSEIKYKDELEVDAYDFLPKWLHPR